MLLIASYTDKQHGAKVYLHNIIFVYKKCMVMLLLLILGLLQQTSQAVSNTDCPVLLLDMSIPNLS